MSVPPTSESGAELEFAQERAAILSTAVGIARHHLQSGRPQQALLVLDVAVNRTHQLRFDSLVSQGHDAEQVEALLGKRDG